MKTTEIRVRPVIRHVVTRYTPSHSPEPGCVNGPSLETLGEFDSEGFAEQVAGALREQAARRVFAIVEETMGVIDARVYYACDEQEARGRQALLGVETGKSFRIYSRLVEHPLL